MLGSTRTRTAGRSLQQKTALMMLDITTLHRGEPNLQHVYFVSCNVDLILEETKAAVLMFSGRISTLIINY